jgi:hypothetical protein
MLKNYLCCRVLVLHCDIASHTSKNLNVKFFFNTLQTSISLFMKNAHVNDCLVFLVHYICNPF